MKTPRAVSPALHCETAEHAKRLTRREPSRSTLEAAASTFQAAGSPQRLELLILLREGALSVAGLAAVMQKPPSLVSQHLGILRGAALVRGVRHGRFVVYELYDAHARIFVDSAVAHARRLGGGTSP